MILCKICGQDYDYNGHDKDCPLREEQSLIPFTMEGQNKTKLLDEYEKNKRKSNRRFQW